MKKIFSAILFCLLFSASAALAQTHTSVNPPPPQCSPNDAAQPNVSWSCANKNDVLNWFQLYANTLGLLTSATGMNTSASNASLPAARLNSGIGHPVSVADFKAKADALTYADGTITSGSHAFSSASATFTAADVGKSIQIDGAAGVGSAPLNTTIANFVDSHDITLTAAATATTPLYYFAGSSVGTAGLSGSYIPGETVTLVGGTQTSQAVATIQDTFVESATVNAGGTGGTTGTCIVQGTTGIGTPFHASVTISGGAITSIGSITSGGHYFTNPTSLSAEPVTNAPTNVCAPTGATLSLTMWADTVSVNTAGIYSARPSSPVSTGAGSSSGATGLTLNPSWNATGTFVYGTDASAAVKSTINQAEADFASGSPAYVYVPAGNYLIDANSLPTMTSGIGVVGEGSYKTQFFVGASYSGSLFSWSDAWLGTSPSPQPFNANTGLISSDASGPKAIGFSVMGFRTASATQNALAMYDHNDLALIDDIDVRYLNGSCLLSGVELNDSSAYTRESRVRHLRCYNDGSGGAPVVEFTSQGGGDGSNEIDVEDVDIYAPYGTGFWIRNQGTGSVRNIKISKLRVEGLEGNAANVAADLLEIGDPTATGIVNSVDIAQLELLDPYTGYAAVRLTAPNSMDAPYLISLGGGSGTGSGLGIISGGAPLGYGIKIDAGRSNYFHLAQINTYNTNISAGANAGAANVLDANGQESLLTYNLNAGAGALATLPRKYGNPASSAGVTVGGQYPDGTTLGGNARGSNSVDLQSLRTTASQVASGTQSVIGGGNQNTASGSSSTVSGGFGNIASGVYTAIPGGRQVTDRGLNGGMDYASNCQPFQIIGACQTGVHTLGATGSSTSAIRPTSNGSGTANSTNCINIPTGSAYSLNIGVSAHDRISGDIAIWNWVAGALYRQSGNAVYSGGYSSATGPSVSTAGLATVTVTISADTSNQCLNVSFTPPAANTDVIDVTAVVQTVESQ